MDEQNNGEIGDRFARLADLVAEFRANGYPSDVEAEHEEARLRHELTLRSLADIAFENRGELKRVWGKNSGYGASGIQVSLNMTIDDATETEWSQIVDSLQRLCFGEGRFEDRIDAAIRDVRGLGPVIATRLLAICYPQRLTNNYVISNKSIKSPGKLNMIELLDDSSLLDEAESREAKEIAVLHRAGGHTGAVAMRSNDLLLELCRPYFTRNGRIDTWGISRFLYWLVRRDGGGKPAQPNQLPTTSLELTLSDAEFEKLSDDLLCDADYLRELVALLQDKGQIVLYGPPGTGKTYLARRLARALVSFQGGDQPGEHWENGRYSLVQFHPAYSYEDFFEGFRPKIDDSGQLIYELTPGPLVRLATRAAEHPDELHVMVIDEINRANLPRVLGELLYLLEYRDEWTQTQYRPVSGFRLPSNLWIIGTMNTADRSIALIDAAMRRRFHFVPFFPDRDPTAGLLRRWCEANEPGQAWVADLLDEVNERLRGDLGGDYMLIGPSYFMKRGLDETSLRRIWEYNIEPLIEDQFFGRRDVINSYRFGEVWKRHGPAASASDGDTGERSEPFADAAFQSVQADDTPGEEEE